jgi:hypothetical protein
LAPSQLIKPTTSNANGQTSPAQRINYPQTVETACA